MTKSIRFYNFYRLPAYLAYLAYLATALSCFICPSVVDDWLILPTTLGGASEGDWGGEDREARASWMTGLFYRLLLPDVIS